MIQFAGITIHGTHGPPTLHAPEVQVKRIKYWGIFGERELRGRAGGRSIEIKIVLHHRYSRYQALEADLKKYDQYTGQHGTLQVSRAQAGINRVLKLCTFHGFEPDGDPDGRDGPLQDVAGTLDGGWWIKGTLRFYQLKTDA